MKEFYLTRLENHAEKFTRRFLWTNPLAERKVRIMKPDRQFIVHRRLALFERMGTEHPPSPYREPTESAVVQQVIVLVLAAGILDGGDLFRICLIAAVAFWVGVVLIRRHRPQAPTKLDLMLIRGGYLVLCIMSFFLVQLFWKLRGLPGLL
jgi:hypothetical protein